MTLANGHYVDSDIAGTASGTGSWTSSDDSTQERTIAYPQNRSHLNGQAVDILQDGVDTAGVITAGAVVPALTGTTNHVGLNFVSTLTPSKLDLEGMGCILTKKITKLIVSFYNTLKGKAGTKSTRMETIGFGTTLFEGIKEVPVNGGYEREGDLIITQDKPLPMHCRGVIIETGEFDKV